ncbi:MAG: AAA-like domain-containing protein [Anaerolineales bacterium]|nr:AAA-like domain-containing protein [Anaerolineales bacterium]
MEAKKSDFVVGGAVPLDVSMYVKRSADDELFNSVLAGQFCYIFAPHHLGKSSLMLRTDWRLQQHGFSTATIDFSGLGTDVDVAALYLLIIKRLKYLLKLSPDPDLWWAEHASLDIAQRFINFLRDVVLAEVVDPIAISLDGITSILPSAFLSSFLAAIGTIYEARATDAIYNRLNFILLGVSMPPDLVKDPNLFPLSIAKKIELSDFSLAEVQVLQQGLQAVGAEQGAAVFQRIFYWTNGHPYLTQKLCSTIAKMWDGHWNDERVDELVERLFHSAGFHHELDLQFVIKGIKTSPRKGKLLALYSRIYAGKQVAHDEQSLDQSELKLVGLVRAKNGFLQIHNEIYRLVFNQDWIKANTPVKWTLHIIVVSILLVLLLTGAVIFYIQQQEQRRTQAQALMNSFRSETSSDKRITNLAALFNLSGYEEDARQLFYNDLDPADQYALFELDNPSTVGRQLITVIKGLYTDPHLAENDHDNELLNTMAQPLSQLKDTPSLGSIELEMEISQWRKGREFYHTNNQYQQALNAYNIAIKMNDSNPGVYFDRGLAYAALSKVDLALQDFIMVLQLDESWQPKVQQTILSNSQLYDALWNETGLYQELMVLLPTPTSTPTFTSTPTPTGTSTSTATPIPTSTPTSPPATSTPTLTPTLPREPISNTPTSVASTPTPDVPMGVFTLLRPLLEDPSYGPTTFEWQWSGPLPSDYGFEVRVWREGSPPAGVHNAVLDNQNGNIKSLGNNTYKLDTNITNAFGVQAHSGEYLWTVALVRVNPKYADLGIQAPPGTLIFAAPGSSGDGKGDKNGGGVGIE